MKILDTQTERLLVRAITSASSLLEHVDRDLAYAELTREELALCLRLLEEAKGTTIPKPSTVTVGGLTIPVEVDPELKGDDWKLVKGGR